MRKGLILALVLLVGLCGITYAGIKTSKHDFRTNQPGDTAVSAGYTGDVQVCRACHVPHNTLKGTPAFTQSLLWRQQTAGAVTGFWTTASYWYTQWRTGSGINQISDLDASSKRCLGCHDGGSFYLFTSGGEASGITFAATDKKVTTLTNAHPVGIQYDITGWPTAEFNSVTEAQNQGIRFVSDGGSWMGCGSCHDPHNAAVASESNFVRVSKTDSALCLACHIK